MQRLPGPTAFFYSWVPSVDPVHAITPRRGQGNITLGSAPFKKRTFYGLSQVLAGRMQSRPRRPTGNEEISKAKAMWRAGEVTKPGYICFCNQIHLLDLQAKGDKDGEEAIDYA